MQRAGFSPRPPGAAAPGRPQRRHAGFCGREKSGPRALPFAGGASIERYLAIPAPGFAGLSLIHRAHSDPADQGLTGV